MHGEAARANADSKVCPEPVHAAKQFPNNTFPTSPPHPSATGRCLAVEGGFVSQEVVVVLCKPMRFVAHIL